MVVSVAGATVVGIVSTDTPPVWLWVMVALAIGVVPIVSTDLSLGKSKRGLANGGLSPKFSEKIGGKSALENRAFSGLIGAFPGPIGAFSGLTPHPTTTREERTLPRKGPFGPIGAFRAKPLFAKPPFGFPRLVHREVAIANP